MLAYPISRKEEKLLGKLGAVDRLLRVIIAEILVIAGYYSPPGLFSTLLSIAGIVVILSALAGHCTLYRRLGINSLNWDRRYRLAIIPLALFAIIIPFLAFPWGRDERIQEFDAIREEFVEQYRLIQPRLAASGAMELEQHFVLLSNRYVGLALFYEQNKRFFPRQERERYEDVLVEIGQKLIFVGERPPADHLRRQLLELDPLVEELSKTAEKK